MKRQVYIACLLLLILSGCGSKQTDPFRFIKVMSVDNTNFQLIYLPETPDMVRDATYSINTDESSIIVKFSSDNNFSKKIKRFMKEDIFKIPTVEQARAFLISESKLPSGLGYTECSRTSIESIYPLLFGLNLVFFIPKKTDSTIFDVYVFSNLLFSNDQFISVNVGSRIFSTVIKSENPIIGNELVLNQENFLKRKHTLEINSFLCID